MDFFLGIFSSFITWIFIYHFITPSLNFFPAIYKEKTDENPSGFKYLIKFKNLGYRDIIDVELIAKLRIKGLYQNKKWSWKAIYIPIDDERIPKIKSQRNTDKRIAIQLCVSKIDREVKASLPKKLQLKCDNETLSLEDLLNLGDESNLQIFGFGFDSFSGTRKIFESKLYNINDIERKL